MPPKPHNKTKKKVRFNTNNNTRKSISPLHQKIYFDDLDEDTKYIIMGLTINYNPDDPYFDIDNKSFDNMPLMVDIKNKFLESRRQVNPHNVSLFAYDVLNDYVRRARRKITTTDEYAMNISEFMSGSKPLPKKFERIMLDQIAMSDYVKNKSNPRTPFDPKTMHSIDTLNNTYRNASIGTQYTMKMPRIGNFSFRRGGKRKPHKRRSTRKK